MNIKKYINKPLAAIMTVLLPLGGVMGFASCSDMLDTTSDMVEFVDGNQQVLPKDTLNSVMGIIRGIQTIADRTIILGDVRSDQFTATDHTTSSLKQIASFNVEAENPYNKISDYYAIINNCNYFIENADTNITKFGEKVFEKYYAAIKTYRAWTYLQLAKNYGEVPLVLKPVLTVGESEAEMTKPYTNLTDICNFFIDDIKPYVDTYIPTTVKKEYFIPVRVLLGELCLWAGRYNEAAQYLHDYITLKNNEIYPDQSQYYWILNDGYDFTTASVNSIRISDYISLIPMESRDYYGVRSELGCIFKSVLDNNYYPQFLPSEACYKLSKDQNYIYEAEYSNTTTKDTIVVPKEGLRKNIYAGDLRLGTNFMQDYENREANSPYSKDVYTVNRLSNSSIFMYRKTQVYLMYAEALNRCGYPEAAFCILKYGMCNLNIQKYVNQNEIERAGSLINFEDDVFTRERVSGTHARGCGDVQCDNNYCVPQPTSALASYEDTVQYQIPLVEQMIIDEMGLEFLYEGKRYYDLMRVALRRNDPAYLADAIAKRNGTMDETLRSKLMDKKNWFLPIK